MDDDKSDPSYPDDIREIQRKAFGMLTGYYCGYAFRAADVRPLMDEVVRLRAVLHAFVGDGVNVWLDICDCGTWTMEHTPACRVARARAALGDAAPASR